MDEDDLRERLQTIAPAIPPGERLERVLRRGSRKKRVRVVSLPLVSIVAAAGAWAAAASLTSESPLRNAPAGSSNASPEMSTPESESGRCEAAPVRPEWLPWLTEGEEVPEPYSSYDSEIDRAQESWQNPELPEGEGGVALTRYPLPHRADKGEPIGSDIEGIEGYINRGEGGTVSASWNLESHCNFVELIVGDPRLTVDEIEEQLRRIARSFEPR